MGSSWSASSMGIINSAKSFDLSMFIAEDAISPEDHWGEMIASGDFNGDGYEDIAISSPNVNTCTTTLTSLPSISMGLQMKSVKKKMPDLW